MKAWEKLFCVISGAVPGNIATGSLQCWDYIAEWQHCETGMLCIAFRTHCWEGDLKRKSWPLITHRVDRLICNHLWQRLMTLLQPSCHTCYNITWWKWTAHRTYSSSQFSGAFITIYQRVYFLKWIPRFVQLKLKTYQTSNILNSLELLLTPSDNQHVL